MKFDLNNLTEGQARQMRRQLKAANYEESLYNFTQRAWREIDSAPFGRVDLPCKLFANIYKLVLMVILGI